MKFSLQFPYLFLLFFWANAYSMEKLEQKNKLIANKRGSLSVDNYSQSQLIKILKKQKNEIEFLCDQIKNPKPIHKYVKNFMYQISVLMLSIEEEIKKNHPTKTIDQSEINNILQEKLSNLGSHLLQKVSKKMKALQKITKPIKKELYYCHAYFYLNCFDVIQIIFSNYGFSFSKEIREKIKESEPNFINLQHSVWSSLPEDKKEEEIELNRRKELIPLLFIIQDYKVEKKLTTIWNEQHQYFQSLKQATPVILNKKNKNTSKITRTRSGAFTLE